MSKIIKWLRASYWVWRMRRNKFYRQRTEGTKWHAGHVAFCVMCAPDDICICEQVRQDVARRKEGLGR